MTETHGLTSPTPIQTRPRKIVRRTRGSHYGPITRLMSPSDLGQVLKPFVFLDLFDMEHASFPGIGLHPHSGIATEQSASAIVQALNAKYAGIQEAFVAIFPPPPVQGMGTVGGFKLYVEDRAGVGFEALYS